MHTYNKNHNIDFLSTRTTFKKNEINGIHLLADSTKSHKVCSQSNEG